MLSFLFSVSIVTEEGKLFYCFWFPSSHRSQNERVGGRWKIYTQTCNASAGGVRGESYEVFVQLSEPNRGKQEVSERHQKVLPHPGTIHPRQDTEQRWQVIYSRSNLRQRGGEDQPAPNAPQNLQASSYLLCVPFLCFFSLSFPHIYRGGHSPDSKSTCFGIRIVKLKHGREHVLLRLSDGLGSATFRKADLMAI